MATDREMLERIAKLSSAIERQKSMNYRAPTRPRGGSSFIARGRGGHMSLNNTYSNPSYTRSNLKHTSYANPPFYPHTGPNKTLVNTSNHRVHPSPVHQTPTINKPVPSHHRTWTLNNNTKSSITKSVDVATGRNQVSIDGVDFIVKGKKLIRKDLVDTNMASSSLHLNAPKVLIRRTIKRQRDKNKNMVIGHPPLMKRASRKRGKGGHLVYTREPEGYVRHGPSSLVLKNTLRPKKKRTCGFFTRYGKCPNATRCPFIHDPSRRAICPRFLKGQCTKPNCRLSHTPNHHIMPHCVHFQRGHCTSDNCIYPHVRVSVDAPVCKAFATEGYCLKALDCDEKHLHVCPEFAETGKCSNANCRLPHVAKSKKQSGIIKLGSWMNPQYFYAQQAAKKEKRQKQQEQLQKLQQPPKEEEDMLTREEKREKEEQDGFVRLFDDSDDDDGWSQYERNDQASESISLRFNEAEESSDEESSEDDEEEPDKEQFEDAIDSPDSSDEEVYEEVSDTEAMSEDDE
ncbi:hypothetical protein BD560DRAFT_484485 [Blakeslea trispora]|nr:hypothetical protein BD560DRAFT_484485 [Blakeslea trispora]